MTNRIAVVLASMVLLGSTGMAQEAKQVLPSDNTIALAEDSTEIYKDVEESSPLDRKVSIRVSNVPISVFLNSITTQAKINFIMSEEFANKKVTASLTRVTVREALDTLLRVHGLAYQRIGKSDSYVVTKRSNDAPDSITKIYTLSYISLQGVGSAQSEMNSVLPQDVSVGGSSGMGGGMGSGMSAGSMGGMNGGTAGGNSYSGGAEITSIISSMLSPVGKIAVDPRTNKLIITDVPEIFPQVENILAELDIKPPQILIEAQIVEVNKTSGLSLGFEYGGSGGTLVTVTGPSRKITADVMHGRWSDGCGNKIHGWDWIFPSAGEIDSDSSSGGGSGGGGSSSDSGENKAGVLNLTAFNIVLKSLLTRGEAKYLGKPKVVTLNNKTAMITTSTDAAIGQVTNNVGGNDNTGGMTTTSAERKRVGLVLSVTPQVNREGYVTLYVQPSYSDVTSSAVPDTWDTITRAASTLVRVKNGQTVVLGGLLTSREVDQTRKVPLLGDIPVLGWLFTSRTKSKQTTDLVIFITPTILAE